MVKIKFYKELGWKGVNIMEDEIRIGEWVRDKDGVIIKVNNIVPDEDSTDIWYEERILQGTWKSMVTNHSSNIINLIEVRRLCKWTRNCNSIWL